MVKPNKFEGMILNAAMEAQEFHIEMTGGQYLWYSHESFLQNFIAIELSKVAGCCIYVDPSPKKIREASAFASKNPPARLNLKQRFDLVCWLKTEDRVKAIIEIKVSSEKAPVLEDVRKVSSYQRTRDGRGIAGYVLHYTDKARNEKWKGNDGGILQNRFQRVDDEMKRRARGKSGVGLRHGVNEYIMDEEDGDPWGFALYRC